MILDQRRALDANMESCAWCAFLLLLPAPLLQIDLQRIFMIKSSIKCIRLLNDKKCSSYKLHKVQFHVLIFHTYEKFIKPF